MRSRAGRVLGLAVVAVLVLSAVGLAATQTFINKTGKTVIGIKVEFSKSVRITRHDSALPDQAPNGRSDQFTFSGGELHNYGRFSIAWLPSSGKVTHYEWIEKDSSSQQATLFWYYAFNRVFTYLDTETLKMYHNVSKIMSCKGGYYAQ